MKFKFLIFFFGIFNGIFAQRYDYAFRRATEPVILKNDTAQYRYPYIGGINSCQFSVMDLNEDGIPDLLAFDKHGNRLMPFINDGKQSQNPYHYAPECCKYFPPLHDWVITRDFDGDGLMDIFTYELAGVAVYRNLGNLQFERVTDCIESYYYNGYSNLYCTSEDYIVIEDLDGDGDLDILAFSPLGKYVHYHRNLSMEEFGNRNHLKFRLEDECWGKFSEGESDNVLTLHDFCVNGKTSQKESFRHTGSTMAVLDYNQNGTPDLILGDVDYPNLIRLQNGGTPSEALMTSQVLDFPPQKPVFLYSMPCVNFIDTDNDGRLEMIVSPFDASLVKSQNAESVWLYKMDNGNYERITTAFLQEDSPEHGSGAYPVFYDWNGDGLLDLFVSNFGYYDSSVFTQYVLTSYYSSAIAYYQNVGTATNPKFKLITKDFGDLRKFGYQGLYPAFMDLNGDGIPDMLCGNANGKILAFDNTGTIEHPQFELKNPNYLNDSVAGGFGTIQCFDVTRSGLQDLLVGNRRGLITYFENIGTLGHPQFEKRTDNFGGVDVRNISVSVFGYSVPCFFRMTDGSTALFVGSDHGDIYFYKQIDHNLNGNFTLADNSLFYFEDSLRLKIHEGIRVGVAVADLNNDGFLDLMTGNYAGGLTFFSGFEPPDSIVNIVENVEMDIRIYPNPTSGILQIQGESVQRIEILDLLGKSHRIITSDSTRHSVDISDLPSGIYFIHLSTAQPHRKTVRKIIKL